MTKNYYGPLSKYEKRDGPFKVFRVRIKETNSRVYEVTGASSMKEAKAFVDEHGIYEEIDGVQAEEVDGWWQHHHTHKAQAVESVTITPCRYHLRLWKRPSSVGGHFHTHLCSSLLVEGDTCRGCLTHIEKGHSLIPIEEEP